MLRVDVDDVCGQIREDLNLHGRIVDKRAGAAGGMHHPADNQITFVPLDIGFFQKGNYAFV